MVSTGTASGTLLAARNLNSPGSPSPIMMGGRTRIQNAPKLLPAPPLAQARRLSSSIIYSESNTLVLVKDSSTLG